MSFDPEEFLNIYKMVRITSKSIGKPIVQCSTLHVGDIGVVAEVISPVEKRYAQLVTYEQRKGRHGLFGTPVYKVVTEAGGQGIFLAMDLENTDKKAPPAYTLLSARIPRQRE